MLISRLLHVPATLTFFAHFTTLSLHLSVQAIELFGDGMKLTVAVTPVGLLYYPCMKKAGRKADSATVVTDELQAVSAMVDARQLFFSEVFGLSWRLAFTVLVPLIAGIQLDKRYASEPLYTLIGLGLAFVLGSVTVWVTYKRVNAMQQVESNKRENS